jgi:SAM-dependent methyltransferase
MSFWDQQFSVPGFKYGTAPNAFLREQAGRLAPASTILVPGDGEGRNGVWLATQGHHVTAIDSSRVGLEKARALALEQGVTVHTQESDLAAWSPAPGSVDAVVLIYVHLPPALRPIVHVRLLEALRAGGVLILEAFHPAQLGRASGGPKDTAMLYTLAMLRADVAAVTGAGFEELVAWEGVTHLDEGPGHQGDAHVVRFVVRRVAIATP